MVPDGSARMLPHAHTCGSSGCASKRESQSGRGRASLFSTATRSASVARQPALAAPAKPVLRARATTRTCGYRSRSSATDASLDPLSTTMTSAGCASCAASASSVAGRCDAPFQLGTTTATGRPLAARLIGPPADDTRRRADSYRVGRYVLDDDGIGPDDGAIADLAADHDGMGTDPRAGADLDVELLETELADRRRTRRVVVARDKHDARREQRIDSHARPAGRPAAPDTAER